MNAALTAIGKMLPPVRRFVTDGEGRLRRGRAVAVLGLAVVLGPQLVLAAAWGGVLGEGMQRWAGDALIGFFDVMPPNLAPPEVSLDFSVVSVDRRSQREGFSNQECRSHEALNVKATLSRPSYLLLLSWDGRTVRSIDDSRLTPKYRTAGSFRIDTAVTLDTTPGTETIYAIASPLTFSYDRDVKPSLEAETEGSSKGAELSVRPLILPDRFRVARIHCQHTH